MIGTSDRRNLQGENVSHGSNRNRAAALAAFLLASLAPALASAQALGGCGSGAPETWIAPCTAIIDNPRATLAERIGALKARGLANYRQGNIDQAGADFTAVTGLAPNDAEAWINLGMTRQARGDFDGAITNYDKAIALDPTSWVAHVDRANALRFKRDLDGAIAAYDRALALKGDLAAALTGRALARAMRRDLNGAVADATAALKIDPGNIEALLGRGNAFRLQGNFGKALDDYNETARLAPDQFNAWLNRGAILMEMGEIDAAIESFDKVIALNPQSVEAYNNRGAALSQKGDLARAMADLDNAVKLGPNSEEAYGNRGFARLALGDFKGAAADFDQLAIADPSDPYRVLWRHIARARAGVADADFAREAAPHVSGPWPGPLLGLYLGRTERERVMQIGPDVEPAERQGRRCEIVFYLGEYLLEHNDRGAATTAMREAAQTCPVGFLERIGAIGELRSLSP
jgi:tetratricopeptide (TPR) repeat protein